MFILTNTKESAMAKVVVGFLNHRGIVAIFSKSTSLKVCDSKSNSTPKILQLQLRLQITCKNNSDSRISEKTTPTPNSGTFKNTTPTPVNLKKQLHSKICDFDSITLVMSHFLKSEGKTVVFF